ncbi:MAG TPA: type III pantothenate kinase [Dehalococcoidia bacterium]|nr:type III pantothenate kinase [Dehalococcoidia bacterium]
MLLVIDIGNTSVHIGVFDGERLRDNWRVGTDVERLPDEYALLVLGLLGTAGIATTDIDACALSSTVPPLTQSFVELVRRYFGARTMVAGAGMRSGIRILYDNPQEVGPDRIVDAVAAIKLYGPPLIIVDCGTATVFDAISADGEYVGGAIAPGIAIAADALFQRASRLFRVELVAPPTAIGKRTGHAIQSGLMYGYAGLVEGMVSRMKKELGGEARVVGTGGYVEIIARETRAIDVVDPNLTLVGLRLVYEMNR